MATNSTTPQDRQATTLHHLTRGLERELRLRVEVSNAGSASSSPSTSPATSLVHTLQSCLSNLNQTSRRTANGCKRVRGCFQVPRADAGSHSLSPSQSASSDSSKSGATGCFSTNSRSETESSTVAPLTSISNLPTAASMGSKIYFRSNVDSIGNAQYNPASNVQATIAVQVGGGGPQTNFPSPSLVVGNCAKNGLGATGKVAKPRRSRKSKKPPTQIIEAGPEEFRATVQQLTGCAYSAAAPQGPSGSVLQRKEVLEFVSSQPAGASVARAQAKRPANAMDTIDRRQSPPAARLDTSSTSVMAVIRGPAAVPEQAPGVRFSHDRESHSASHSSCNSVLNYCMGYDQSSLFWGSFRPTEDLGSLQLAPDSLYDFPSELFKQQMASTSAMYTSHDPRATSASSAGANLATPLLSDSKRGKEISRDPERGSFSSDHGARLNSSDDISKSSVGDDRHRIPKHRHGAMQQLDCLDEDVESTAQTRMVDSWLSPSDHTYVTIARSL